MSTETHPVAPVYDAQSKILILGTFPSVKSREAQFFYAHPQNRFWKLLAAITNDTVPSTVDEKKAFLLRNNIAVWDVIHSCDIEGSSDSSITNVVPNDLTPIFKAAEIRAVFANGTKSYNLYQKYCFPSTQRGIIKLPSTSPANASYSLDKLFQHWKVIRDFLK